MEGKKQSKTKNSKLKLQLRGKSYSFKDSPFYKLTTKKKLARLVDLDLSELKRLCSDEHYLVFQENRSGKKREVQQPLPKLDKVHTRIGSLLSRIQVPDYLHSGIKGRTHITNAKQHLPSSNILVTDIKSFYQSTRFDIVYEFFRDHMQCSPDVSRLLTTLSTYKGSIPTGSRLSMPLAFWANYRMFDKLYRLSLSDGISMSVYVDDLTFSGAKVNQLFENKVKKIVRAFKHTCHPKKTKIYKADEIKLVTGVALTCEGLTIQNKQHKSIYEDFLQWEMTKDDVLLESLINRLLGKLNSQGQIDPRFKDRARSLRNEIKKREINTPTI